MDSYFVSLAAAAAAISFYALFGTMSSRASTGQMSAQTSSATLMIEVIATDVSNKLNLSAPCGDFDGLVGMESKMTEMRSLLQLDSDEVRKIGILGPSGIGKTTIARSLFNPHSQDFQLSVFIDNIKRNYAILMTTV
ncbi:hypothetical protein Bca52824_037896 [Brassica carinata]|uniref:Uncharacterized protein n=1 Tax=Brassica carinata TaxID=52824 RepID=A0A8X7UUE2_BRACI|nr:hypothetical protein Bca52824_037896 [Brassica carinata]